MSRRLKHLNGRLRISTLGLPLSKHSLLLVKSSNQLASFILPPEIVSRIYDVVSVEKPTEDSYSKLINALKTRFVKSKDNRLRFVLDEAQMNDMSPSQFYYHLKFLSKDLKLSDELIFNRWLKKLPKDQMIE